MRGFLVISNTAVTDANFSLNDLPGAGRMDVVCRCVNSIFLTSHGIRKDTLAYLLLLGPPDPPKLIRIDGSKVRYLGPDERNIGGLLRKALSVRMKKHEVESSPGIYVSKKSLSELLDELSERWSIYYLKEDGRDIRNIVFKENCIFILGDQKGLTEKQEKILEGFVDEIISVSPLSLHSDHCITIVHSELDRRMQNEKCGDAGES